MSPHAFNRCAVTLLASGLLWTAAPAAAQVTTDESPAATAPSSEPIRLTRKQTRQLQRALDVTADGALGPRTRRAIRRYERRNDLPVDGRPDEALLGALGIEADEPGTAPSGDLATALEAAESAIGSPYASGGNSTSGFDCSGLTTWAFKKAGIELPRTSFAQYEEGTSVKRSELEPGDLVFFDTAGSGASHVGIATSTTTAISATSSKGVVEHALDDDYWGSHYVGARRIG